MFICFSDLFSSYLYDSIVNDIIEISDEMYDALNNKKNIDDELYQEYIKLIDNGFLSNLKHDIKYPIFDFQESIFNRSLSNAVIQVTQNCNFRCEYCVFTDNDGSTRTHNNKKMSWKVMRDSIDFIYKSSIDSNQLTIGFYGGEPFLEIDLIKKAIEYSNNIFKGKPVLYSITTNASLLTDDILKYLNGQNVSLTISLDGPKQINDKFRKTCNDRESAYEHAKDAIIRIANNYPNLAELLNINMVLVPNNSFEEYLTIFDDIPQLKHLKLISSIVSEDGLNIEYQSTESFIKGYEYSNFMNRLIRFNRNQTSDILDKSKLIESSFKQKIGQINSMIATGRINLSPSGPCIPIHHKIFIDIDGNLLPCEKISESIEDIRLGDIYNGVNYNKVKDVVRLSYLTKEECINCWAYNLCSSCIKYCIDQNSISRKARLNFCSEVKNGAKDMLYEYASLKREEAFINNDFERID